jgi:hypothetical protein
LSIVLGYNVEKFVWLAFVLALNLAFAFKILSFSFSRD